MKFREVIEYNRSPRIENIYGYKDIIFMATSDTLYAFNVNSNKIEEVEFTKDNLEVK